MAIRQVESFVAGHWHAPDQNALEIHSAIDGSVIAQAGSGKGSYGEPVGVCQSQRGHCASQYGLS